MKRQDKCIFVGLRKKLDLEAVCLQLSEFDISAPKKIHRSMEEF